MNQYNEKKEAFRIQNITTTTNHSTITYSHLLVLNLYKSLNLLTPSQPPKTYSSSFNTVEPWFARLLGPVPLDSTWFHLDFSID